MVFVLRSCSRYSLTVTYLVHLLPDWQLHCEPFFSALLPSSLKASLCTTYSHSLTKFETHCSYNRGFFILLHFCTLSIDHSVVLWAILPLIKLWLLLMAACSDGLLSEKHQITHIADPVFNDLRCTVNVTQGDIISLWFVSELTCLNLPSVWSV